MRIEDAKKKLPKGWEILMDEVYELLDAKDVHNVMKEDGKLKIYFRCNSLNRSRKIFDIEDKSLEIPL